MYEKLIKLINETKAPLTKMDFIEAFEKIGIKSDSLLEVHASISAFGYIINKEYDICDALIETVTKGVIIMMAHTSEQSDPAYWSNPAVPKDWIDLINKNRRVFDKDIFIPERIGKVPQLFCRYKNVVRTNHPLTSMSVLNNTNDPTWYDHDVDDKLMISPLKKLADRNGKILFLGTDFYTCTSVHLTEQFSPYSIEKTNYYKRLNDQGEAEEVQVFENYIEDDEIDNFKEISKIYLEKYQNTEYYKQVELGLGTITLIDAKKLYKVADQFHRTYRKEKDK